MSSSRPLILLDRDGVINQIVIDSDHGTIDSPLNPGQVRLIPGVVESIAFLTRQGFRLAIVTNQPAFAKGKTTKKNLELVHEQVLKEAQALGGKIEASFICFHRAEDQCACRKPKPGLIEEALKYFDALAEESWMIGDGVTDVQAGNRVGLKTVFLGPKKCDACKVFQELGSEPSLWAKDLASFVQHHFGKIESGFVVENSSTSGHL